MYLVDILNKTLHFQIPFVRMTADLMWPPPVMGTVSVYPAGHGGYIKEQVNKQMDWIQIYLLLSILHSDGSGWWLHADKKVTIGGLRSILLMMIHLQLKQESLCFSICFLMCAFFNIESCRLQIPRNFVQYGLVVLHLNRHCVTDVICLLTGLHGKAFIAWLEVLSGI